MDFDLVITKGKVIDGTGNPWFRADIGIKDGKIAKIGRLDQESARTTIDAKGSTLCPGFIDMHSHDDLIFFRDIWNKPKLRQGVSTVVVGNCGISPAPVNKRTARELQNYLSILIPEGGVAIDWSSYGDFCRKLESLGSLGTNITGLVGHGTVRIAVLGMDTRDPSEEELGQMKELIAQSMREGALGMSTGLIYPPGAFTKTEELIELSKVVSEYGGLYATHIRDEGNRVVEAVAEAIRIGREAALPVEISHYKAMGRSNWGKTTETLRMIMEARREGIDVTADAYPYTAASTYLSSLLPPWAHQGGQEKLKQRCHDPEAKEELRRFIEERSDWQNPVKQAGWENIFLSYSSNYSRFEGMSVPEIAERLGKDPYEAVFQILAQDGTSATMILFLMNEADVEKVISHPYVMIGTDGIPDLGVGTPHPRAYGSFPRVLGTYARDRKLMTIEDAIRKMTSQVAQKLGLSTKGLIRQGFDADITILDVDAIADKTTYHEPRSKPEGVEYVIVNGIVSIEKGELTGNAAGRVIIRKA